MNQEQKKLVEEIQILEKEIKSLTKKIDKTLIDTNELKVMVVNKREKLRNLYLKLKEVTEAQKSPNPPTD
jgi:hypothetical protein